MNAEQIRERKARWYQENRERVLAQQHEYYEAHHADPERRRRKQGRAARNPNHNRASQARYRVTPRGREVRRAIDQRYRARRAGASGSATAEQVATRMAFYGGRCWMCKSPATTIDHVIPLAQGGSNWPANLRPACRDCNSRKGSRLRSLDPVPSIAPMSATLVGASPEAMCSCGEPATFNGRECPSCARARLGTIHSAFTPTRSPGAGQVDPAKSRRWDNRLEDYRRVRMEGSQPRTTRRSDIDAAKRASDTAGRPFRADAAALSLGGA